MFRIANALALAILTVVVLTHSPPSALAVTEEWPQLGDTIFGTSGSTDAGKSVAMSSDGAILAVGSWEDTSPGSGGVRMYELSSDAWVQKGSALAGEALNDRFGNGLALSADGLTVAIGAPVNGTSQGQVKIYTWDEASDAWVAKGSVLTGSTTNTQFGYAVSLSGDGDILAVGAPNETTSTGKVYVYTWDTGSSPAQWATPVAITGEDTFETFGRALDINSDGTVVVVGARGNGDSGANSGETRVYALSGSSSTRRGADIPGEAAGDLSGQAVAISADGTVIAVGAPENDGGGVDSGHVRTYSWDGAQWNQRGADIDGDSAGDEFGYSVDISNDGLTVVAGSPERSASSGGVMLLTYASGAWGQQLSLTDATTFVGGSPGADTVATNSGLARVFRLSVAAEASASSETAGLPGIYLHVAGPVGRLAEGSPVYYGSDRVAITSSYLLSITNVTTNTTSRVLAEGVVDARGNLEARALLPSLQPGDYDVVFQGKHRGGAGLRLSARITVGDAGQIMTLGPNIPTVW
jgi:hypothetical protein